MPLSNPAVVIPNGNSLELSLNWRDMSGADEAPTKVVYQVFDMKTDEAVSGEEEVPDPEAEMTFIVPGEHLVNDSKMDRSLVIQVRGTFQAPTDTHTGMIEVLVKRGYSA